MAKKIITVYDDVSIEEVCGILAKHGLSGVPVVDKNKKLVGFISERDIIANFGKKCLTQKAGDLMQREVIFIKYGTSIEEASKIFTEKKIRHLPIVKNGRVVDIISRKDIIKHLVGHYY